ncbi:MAG TPA: flagellar basal body P-ring protein FlgI [bacterium]|nr:flagellar basal body P-ring protein FlgI [bacterium]
MKRTAIKIALAIILAVMLAGATEGTPVRVKDLASVRGARDNQLVGYGLVVGLNGTGDSNKSAFTLQSVASMLASFGVQVSQDEMKLKNVAAVMLTATIPAFAGSGDRLDVTVSSLGDAKTLEGGVLLQTPLKAGNGQVYAVAQGAVAIGGMSGGTGGRTQRNHPTVGIVPGGALVENDLHSTYLQNNTLELALRAADFTTAQRVAAAVNAQFGATAARALDAGRVRVALPAEYAGNPVGFIAQLEELTCEPAATARVIINERTGTVVLGGDVRLDACAISHGTLHITIVPPPVAPVENEEGVAVAPAQPVTQLNQVLALPAGTSVTQVVDALNAVGAGPREVIAVLQAIDRAGALHATLVVM